MSRLLHSIVGALWLSGFLLSMGAAEGRRTLSLDGTWQLAEGHIEQKPRQFDRTVPVPGLVDLAEPGFAFDTFKNTKRRFGPEDAEMGKRSYWYRREVVLDGPLPAVATLLVRKATYGSTVYVNGTKVGESLASFTANWYDVRHALRGGGATNELLIRVGASRASLPPSVPTGFDYEKKYFIPGLFDSVELILSGTPNFVHVQVAPDITNQEARVAVQLHNAGSGAQESRLKFVVREAKSGKVVGQTERQVDPLSAGADQTVEVRVPVADCQLWCPEAPFLYTLQVSNERDSYETRFGMREFRFEPRHGDMPGRAYLNGKPYFLRGSNVALYRFLEDTQRADLPWQEDWVRRLHQRFKGMHWNALRYCIGLAPELWYRIADEEGMLIQDEFPIWEGGQRINWPVELERDELAREYTAWLQERWNHPCVVIWDAQNESLTTETGAAIALVRGLDLSNRPWDNGWSSIELPTDSCESHPYHWGDPHTTLSKAFERTDGPWTGGDCKNPDNRNAYIINEYADVWVTRDGKPTRVTRDLYANLAGKDAPPSTLLPLAARLVAAETEYWRCDRRAAGVLHFCALAYSRSDEPTSDHWLDVRQLAWNPDFYHYVRDAFAPIGLMVVFTKERVLAGSTQAQLPVVVINDLEETWQGPVILRLKVDGKVETEVQQKCVLKPWGKTTLNFEVKWPNRAGACTLEAELAGAGGQLVRSLRDTRIVDRSAFGPGVSQAKD